MFKQVKKWLENPDARGINLDTPEGIDRMREILQKKKFIRKIYEERYQKIIQVTQKVDGPILELGSGGGFLSDMLPGVIRTDVMLCKGVDSLLKGEQLPFRNNSLGAIVMVDVLHHIPNARKFFREAIRTLHPQGKIVFFEPWVTVWSSFIYKRVHHEPFLPEYPTWEFPNVGPLTGANIALPWIIFCRDQPQFLKEFPDLTIDNIELLFPFRYLVSGGLLSRSMAPVWSYTFWKALERLMHPWMNYMGTNAKIVLTRVG